MKFKSLIAVLALAAVPAFAQSSMSGTSSSTPASPGIQSDGSNTQNQGGAMLPGQGGTINSESETDTTNRVPSADSDMRGAGSGTDQSQSTTSSTTTSSTSTTSADSGRTDLSPKEICEQFVQLTKSGSAKEVETQMSKWVMAPQKKGHMKGKGAERGGKLKLDPNHHQWLKQELSEAECSKETVAGERAFVVAKGKERERFIPFMKQGQQWKVDMGAYHAMYRGEGPRGK